MAKSAQKSQKEIINRVYSTLSFIAAFALIVLGSLALWAHQFTSNMVQSELAAQKIYFPEKGSPAFDPAVYPDIQQYAGELVDTAEEAKAYANGYIGRHLEKAGGGKVYAEVSAAAMKDPQNEQLQQQKTTLFQGETLRGILLGTGYAYGTIGNIAGVAAYVCLGAGIALILAGLLFRQRTK